MRRSGNPSGVPPEMPPGPFGEVAIDLARLGLSVIPCGGDDGKVPLVKWKNWTKPPGRPYLLKLVNQFGGANIGVICGLSRVTIVDVDDPNVLEMMVRRHGDTPLKTATPSGGMHLWYRHGGETNANLRPRENLPVDIKGVGGMVIVPPSIRPSGPHAGKPYGFVQGGWTDLGRLPALKSSAFGNGERRVGERVGEGCRNDVLFKKCLRFAQVVDSLDDLIDAAIYFAEEGCEPPLPKNVARTTAASAWRYEQEGRNCSGREPRVFVTTTEADVFGNNADALLLWIKITLQQGATKSEPFALSAAGMRAKGFVPKWSTRRYRTARDWLIENGFLAVVHKGGAGIGDPSLFTFGKGRDSNHNITRQGLPPSVPSAHQQPRSA